MAQQSGNEQDSVRLSEDSAAVVLARATQLDAARAANVSVAELRRAALDAGIAPEAFEQALAEFRAAGAVGDVERAGRTRRRWYWIAAPVLTAALFLALLLLRGA
jgi:hypothetical protein